MSSWASGPAGGRRPLSKDQKAAISRGLAANHRAFVENKGQWDRRAEFRAQSDGLDFWLRKDGVTFNYHRPGKHNGKMMQIGQVIKMDFAGSKGTTAVAGAEQKAHTAQYLVKKSSNMLQPRAFGEVTSHSVYPGVDFRSYYDKNNLRYDFNVAPNADASQIHLKFAGASKLTVHRDDLKLGTQLGTFGQGKLFAYQLIGSKKVRVPASFVAEHGSVGFKLGRYDHSKRLVIDPVVYGTYYGGDDGWDSVTSVVADSAGNVFMTGWTQATLFPITTGPYFTSLKGTQNAFVARLQGDAYNIDFSAFFGGSNVDFGQYIAVDQFNNVWIAGVTTSPDFPLNTKVNTSPTEPNVFLMRWQASPSLVLDPITNPAIQMFGYDGGGGAAINVQAFAIAPDPNPSPGDPVKLVFDGKADHALPEVPATFNNDGQGYLVSYTYTGTTFANVVGATQYIGDGLNIDMGGLAIDVQGDLYVAGDVGDGVNNYDTTVVGATTFVTTNGVFAGGRLLQKNDLFIRKYNGSGVMQYSCLIGGAGNEYIGGTDVDQAGTPYVSGDCLAVDSLGNAYVTGNCNSFDYPRTRGAYGEIFDAFQNVVVTKISPDASQIIYSTNLKVTGLGEPVGAFSCGSSVVPSGIAIDQSGQAYITGNIDPASLRWPTSGTPPFDPTGYTPGSIQTGTTTSDPVISATYTFPSPFPTCDDWLNVLDPTGTKLVYGTYLGGAMDDKAYGPYVDSFGDVWVFGWTDSGRIYIDPVSGNFVVGNGALPAGMITPKAFKHTGDAGLNPGFLANVLWGFLGGGNYPGTIGILETKDGWLTKFSIGRPIVSQVNLTPTTVPGGLGATSSCGIVLSSAAPIQGASITVNLLTSNLQASGAASFSASSQVTTITVAIPGGATAPTSPLTIYTNAVTSPTQVLVRAYYQGNFLIAPLNVVPWLTSFSVTPNGVVGGNAITGTLALAAVAPTGGVTVQIQSSLACLAPPATVSIAAGQQTASFVIPSLGVDTKLFPVLSASLLSYGIAQSVEVDPASIQSVVLNPLRVSGGTSVTGTITLNGLPGPNYPPTTVLVQTNPTGYVVTPATILGSGWSGSGQATFTIQTPYEPATISRVCEVDRPASLGYVQQQSLTNFIVDTTALTTFTLDKYTANPGDTVNGTVTLGSPADLNGAIVTVTASSNVVSFSNSAAVQSIQIVVPAGSTGASFPIFVGSSVVTSQTSVTFTATRGTVSLNPAGGPLIVQPSTLQLTLSPASILGGTSTLATVTISNPAPVGAGVPITITFNPTGFASIAAPVVIPPSTPGNPSTSVSFPINTVAVTANQDVIVTASTGSLSSQQTLTVRAPSLVAISFTPSRVIGLRTTVCKITLDGPAAAGGTLVTLVSSNPLAATIRPTVTVPAGLKIYAFTVLTRRISRPLSTTVTASSGTTQVSALLTVVRY
ncbi:MAG: DUF7948 domain-containing protein [Fimbriimonadaceae bacterium]